MSHVNIEKKDGGKQIFLMVEGCTGVMASSMSPGAPRGEVSIVCVTTFNPQS